MKKLLMALLVMGSMAGMARAAGDLVAGRLRCEYLTNPLGLDVAKPRLSWVLEDADRKSEAEGQKSEPRGRKQAAYQILVASTAQLLAQNQGDLWDSGKVVTDQSGQIEYGGKPLASRQQGFWKVGVWTGAIASEAKATWSQAAMWEMGLLKRRE